jgi:NAD(P)H-nitrite reductase large subunit
MQDDDELCLCFHVTRRKVASFIRIERPVRASQISGCSGAGTGCGWCRPFLEKMFDNAVQQRKTASVLPSAKEYSQMRKNYIEEQQRVQNSEDDERFN